MVRYSKKFFPGFLTEILRVFTIFNIHNRSKIRHKQQHSFDIQKFNVNLHKKLGGGGGGGGHFFPVLQTNNCSFMGKKRRGGNQRALQCIVCCFVRLCSGRTKLPFPVANLNSLFVWAMRSLLFAGYTNANNTERENAVLISAHSY
jgi:hypothetical protein